MEYPPRDVGRLFSWVAAAVGSAGMFDAVDVVGEVVAKRGLAAVGLPGLLPQEVSVLVARQPLLPGVVNPHDHHVFDLSLTEREVNQEC